MKNPFQFINSAEYEGIVTQNYIYKNLCVVISTTNYCFESKANLPLNQECLHISFSLCSGAEMKQRDIDACLEYFGLNISNHFYFYEEMSSGVFGPKRIIKHYEQLLSKTVGMLS